MITNPTVIWILCACAAILSAAAAAPFVFRHLTPAWRHATPFGRFTFILGLTIGILFGGTKTNSVDTAGTTNEVSGASLLLGTFAPRSLVNAITVADFALVRVTTNENPSFALPPDGRVRGTWHLTGAFDDVRDISLDGFEFPLGSDLRTSFWAYTSGKIRPRLANASNEIAAVGAPLSALPGVSRLWTAASSNDTYLLTWENFRAGRIPLPVLEDADGAVNAQIELFPSGDFITRSNGVERLYRRRVPGIETEGYGPHQQLEIEENASAYYTIDLVVSTADTRVTFAGDGPSNLPDPDFIARAGETNRVELLIGKTYDIRCDMPFDVIGVSDWRVDVFQRSRKDATVVWPVDIYMDYGTPLLMGPLHAPRLGAPQGGNRICVDPDWLNGTVSMPSNVCCGVSGTGGEFEFDCGSGDCGCGGCTVSGTYTYEGYTLAFGGWECGCVPQEDESLDYSTYGISVPEVVFKGGALRELYVWFDPGADDDNSGRLVLTPTQGQDKIRIWTDERKTAQALQFSWPVAEGVSCTYYIEGVEASDSVDDIEFKLEWEKEDGPAPEHRQMTCAEVEEVRVSGSNCGSSPNPPPFTGQEPHDFDVTKSLPPDQHAVVFYKDVVNERDFSIYDFGVDIELHVKPTRAPVGRSSWFKLDPSPASGSVVYLSDLRGRLLNPKEGGVYHIGAAFSGSRTNECNIVLPLAGASVDGILQSDLARADTFARKACARYALRDRNSIRLGLRWFVKGGNGDYLGRANNSAHPTVWQYNQVSDADGQGARCTLKGVPIRNAKLSNLLAAYLCAKIGVSTSRQTLSQLIGKWNGISASVSWDCGTQLANGADFDQTVSNMVHESWFEGEDRVIRLWPNLAPADDWNPRPFYTNWNHQFYSPGCLSQEP